MIYIVCSCDIWKMRNSMRIITATTSIAKLKQLIAQLIEDGTFGYGVAQNPDGNDAAIRFREDYNNRKLDVGVLNDILIYGYVEAVADGEF
jgi:hypothetical protein